MTQYTIRWILFDLGNVLVDHVPSGTTPMARFLNTDIETLHAFLLEIDASRRLCSGDLGPTEFIRVVNERFASSATPEMITAWFGPEIEAVYPEVPGLVKSLAGRYSLAILSNTFFGHWDYFVTTELARSFDVVLASHLLGCVKPGAQIYEKALKRMTAKPAETLFIDDREENVAGARAVGMLAFRSGSPAETIRGLEQFGIQVS